MAQDAVKSAALAARDTAVQGSAIVKTNDKALRIKGMLEKMKPQLQASLVKKINPDYVISTALTAIRQNPKLLECTEVSLIACIIQSNQLGLRLDGPLGHAYLVPYFNSKKGAMEAQFMPGYRGLIDLARRSKEIVNLFSNVVRQHDRFEFEYGTNEHLTHVPAKGERGDIIHVYAYAKLTTGGFLYEVMSVDEVEDIRSISKAKDAGPWKDHWEEMARKTVVRRLSKYLPMTVELATAVRLDETVADGHLQHLEVTEEGSVEVVESTPNPPPAPQLTESVQPAQEESKPEPGTTGDQTQDAQGSPTSEPPAPQSDPFTEVGKKRTEGLLKAAAEAKTQNAIKLIRAATTKHFEAGEITENQKTTILSALGQSEERMKVKS